nr:MAG: Single-strand binding protein family protein [Bacteriophage sp.]
MNNVSLIGRLTKDVEERRTQNGTPVVSFTLAVDRRKKEDGADFINCIAWDKAAETIARYVHKGDLFGVTGYIQTRNYEKDGRMNYVTEVVTTSFQFLERKREMSSDGPSVQNNSNFDNSWGNTRNYKDSSDLPF